MLLAGRIYIALGPWHFGSFRNIFLPNVGEDCGGPPSSLSREGPQFPSSLQDYSSIACSPIYCMLPKWIHKDYHNRWLTEMNFFSCLSCHVGSQKSKTDYFSLRHRKKRVAKKNIITTDGVNRIPTIPPTRASDDWYNRPKPEWRICGNTKKLKTKKRTNVITAEH